MQREAEGKRGDARELDVYAAFRRWREDLIGILRRMDAEYVAALEEDLDALRQRCGVELVRRQQGGREK